MIDTALTDRELAVLDAIRDSITDRGFPPTLAEIGDGLGLVPSTVHYTLGRLASKGAITREPNSPRAIRICDHDEVTS